MRQARGRWEEDSGIPWAVRRRSSWRLIVWVGGGGGGVGVGVGVGVGEEGVFLWVCGLEGRVGMDGLSGVLGGVAFGFGACGCEDSSVVVGVMVFRSVLPVFGDTASSSPM